MSKTVVINGALVTILETDFKCPKCDEPYTEKDWLPRYLKAKKGVIYKKCRKCKLDLGISTLYNGDVTVWLRMEEL